MSMTRPSDPWADLTEDVPIPYRDEHGARQVRVFRLREMSRRDCDKLTDLYFEGVERLKADASSIDPATLETSDLVKRMFGLQWETQAPALQFILREPLDGGEPPSLDWIRAHLNERRTALLTSTQDRLNGTAASKKKAAELSTAITVDATARAAGSSSTTESPAATDVSPTRSPDDTATARPSS